MSRDLSSPKRRMGFATLDTERRRAICSSGGKAAHAEGKAYEFTSETARTAGRKGGAKTAATKGSEHFRAIGKLGAEARRRKREERAVAKATTLVEQHPR